MRGGQACHPHTDARSGSEGGPPRKLGVPLGSDCLAPGLLSVTVQHCVTERIQPPSSELTGLSIRSEESSLCQ